MSVTLVGVDPGLVDTGAVSLTIDPQHRSWSVDYARLDGGKILPISSFVNAAGGRKARVFVEAYRDRGTGFKTNSKMRELVQDIKRAMPFVSVIDNAGMRQVIRPKLMELLGLDDFPRTHHKDLESAANIMLYGAVKDEQLNDMLSRLVMDHLLGDPWTKR